MLLLDVGRRDAVDNEDEGWCDTVAAVVAVADEDGERRDGIGNEDGRRRKSVAALVAIEEWTMPLPLPLMLLLLMDVEDS